MATGRRVQYIIDVDESGAVRGARRVDQQLKNVDKSSGQASKGMGRMSTMMKATVAGAAATAALALQRFVRSSIEVGSGFEASMSKVAAISQATGRDLARLQSTARELGATTVFSAREAADGMSFLAMAGFETNEIVSAMPGLLNLAAAGQLDLARAADITSNILSGYNLAATDTGRVSDILAAASTSANVNIEQLGESMKLVGPVASNLGFEIEETTAAIGIMGDAGLQGSISGTALRSALLRMINPAKEVATLMDDIGISATHTDGSMKSLAEILEDVEQATAHMTDAQRAQTLATIFGREAVSGFSALLSAGSKELTDFTEGLRDSEGRAKDLAEQMNDNLIGDTKELQSAFDETKIALYELFDEGMRDSVQGITAFVRNVNEAIDSVSRLGDAVGNTNAILHSSVDFFSRRDPFLGWVRDAAVWAGWIEGATHARDLIAEMDAGTARITGRIGDLNAQIEHFSALQEGVEEGTDLWAFYETGILSAQGELANLQHAFSANLDELYEQREQVDQGTMAYMQISEEIRQMSAALQLLETTAEGAGRAMGGVVDGDIIPDADEQGEKITGLAGRIKALADARKLLFAQEELSDDDVMRIQMLTAEIESLTRKLEAHQQIAEDFLWLPPLDELDVMSDDINALMDEMFNEEQARNAGRIEMIDERKIAAINASNSEAQNEIRNEKAKQEARRRSIELAGQAAAQSLLHARNAKEAARGVVRAVAAEAAAYAMRGLFKSMGPAGLFLAPIAGAAVVKMVEGLIKFNRGGVLKGPSHEYGGIMGMIGGRPAVEMEGGEAVINRRSTRMFLPELSAINQAGGGVPLARQGALTFNHIPRDNTPLPGTGSSSSDIAEAIKEGMQGVIVEARVAISELDERLRDYHNFENSIGN